MEQLNKCMTCHGTGKVDANYYNISTKHQWVVPGGTVPCRSCYGTGYVRI